MNSPRPVTCLLAVAWACAVLAGCASAPAAKVQALQEGDPSYLNRECKLLGTVEGRSIFGGLSDDAKLKGAIDNAREKAAGMGATHVLVLSSKVTGAMGLGEATLRAYRCDTRS